MWKCLRIREKILKKLLSLHRNQVLEVKTFNFFNKFPHLKIKHKNLTFCLKASNNLNEQAWKFLRERNEKLGIFEQEMRFSSFYSKISLNISAINTNFNHLTNRITLSSAFKELLSPNPLKKFVICGK